jgi:hypothetical protein
VLEVGIEFYLHLDVPSLAKSNIYTFDHSSVDVI